MMNRIWNAIKLLISGHSKYSRCYMGFHRWSMPGGWCGRGEGVKDGLYQVTTPYLCAGFVIENGKISVYAPILRQKLTYWKTVAKWICK